MFLSLRGSHCVMMSMLVVGLCDAKTDPNAKKNAAATQGEVKMPSGVDLDRLTLLDQGRMTKVYVEMTGIGDPQNEKLLFPPAVAESIGVTTRQMNRRFMDTVGRSRRFEVYDSASTVTAEESDIVIDGMITGVTQELVRSEGGTRISQTRVRLSVQMKNRYTGQNLFPAAVEVIGQTGQVTGDRVVLTIADNADSPEVQRRLANDYERAMQRAFDAAAGRIDTVLRPLARVVSVDSGSIGLLGGSKHGLQGGDELVVFRAQTTRIGDLDIIASTKPLVVVKCEGVGTLTSQCDVTRRNPQFEVQPGDYAVLTDRAAQGVRVE